MIIAKKTEPLIVKRVALFESRQSGLINGLIK